ncbi:zinc finger protein 26-like isoform X2 [Pararge aegeria]|uniref:zinc finger protein 26-like isoform X2 n=1 Tax=Pararge aegeria TaxID=116150 RepID=UPI0019D1B25C|nr:zinc finger protein 26-like isoform X2 [Pararge aegeria]
MEDNVHDCCRICLDVESRHVSILDDSTINLHIKSCLPINISVNDDLPKSICESCVSQLKEFYNFQLNARCSQDWLESCVQEKSKKSIESKTQVHPLPDSEYNSDSLLEFLNNTENIEEYLNNLDSDIKIVKELMKKAVPKNETKSIEKLSCFACKAKLDTIHKLSQHLSICDNAIRTCIYCNILFDSKQKMREHALIHSAFTPLTCNCGKQFDTKDNLLKHCKRCETDHIASMGFVYSCKQCKATFNEWLQMFQHAKEHVRKSEERICDICGHTFIGEESIAKHRKEKHEKPDNPLYRCKVCSFTSPDRKKIFCHVQKHTQAKSTIRHLCESCGRSFANQSVLRNHSLQHAPKSHKCRICQKGFTDMKLKEEHVLEHIEMVMCEKCGQSVKSYKLAEHVCL